MRSSIFDMIGPIMIGPSSSHTAGVARIGRMARKLLGETPKHVVLTFYNSFATTYEGHGSDRAAIGGLLDMSTDDERLRDALNIAQQSGIIIQMKSQSSAPKLHPNTIRILAQGETNTVEVLGVSRGGGLISITEIDGFFTNLSGVPNTLVILAQDIKGSIAFLSNIIAHDDCNIGTMTVARKGKNIDACLVLELDSPVRNTTLDYMRTLSWVKKVTFIPTIDD
ncbi:MAG: L-serine ammonia-lyase, iron-sulfur-dependent subunit beta [Bacteroidia bacterium]|nr:L-serine ammonia-lyase, iron-sulfur-dependent subunit beta [Bacteroidia bacterium]MDW8158041.1 L-serine ammonia-lyase, iron-sulfur-dependent subunit beta [Bacteroidia bacterium]